MLIIKYLDRLIGIARNKSGANFPVPKPTRDFTHIQRRAIAQAFSYFPDANEIIPLRLN